MQPNSILSSSTARIPIPVIGPTRTIIESRPLLRHLSDVLVHGPEIGQIPLLVYALEHA